MFRDIFDRVARALDEEEPDPDDREGDDDDPPDDEDQGLLHAALVGAGVGLLVSFLLRSTSSAPTNGTTPPRAARVPPRPEPQAAAAALLGVELDADTKTIRDAFRRRVRQIHPDGSNRRLSEAERLKVADEMARLVAARDLLLGRRRA